MSVTSEPRILFVNHSSKPAGAEFVLRDIAKTFYNPTVFLFEDGPFRAILEQQNTAVVLARRNNSTDFSAVKRDSNLLKVGLPLVGSMISLVRQIRQASRGHQIIYANSQKAFVLAALASFGSRKQFIWHCHDILSREHFSNAQLKLDIRLANARASKVFVPSQATADAFIAAGGKKSIVHVLYNGVDTIGTYAQHRTKAELRSSLGLPEGFIYGVFSRIAQWKGQHIAIEALMHLPDARCLIVGAPQFGEQEYYSSLKQLASDLKVSDRVIFLGHRSDVAELMQAVDVYCHPSIAPEPFSLALLEAMRANLPIVATGTGGTPEVIKPRDTGLLALPNDVESMAAGILALQLDPSYAAVLGDNARRLVASAFTIEAMQHNVKRLVLEK